MRARSLTWSRVTAIVVVVAGFACGMATTGEPIGRTSVALVATDCENATAYNGRASASASAEYWRYCPSGYGTKVPFAVPSVSAAFYDSEIKSGAAVVDPTLDEKNFFEHDWEIPTPDPIADPGGYAAAIANCSQFAWFTSSEDDKYPPKDQTKVSSGRVCFGLGFTINRWLMIPGHEADCRRLWMFDRRSWSATADARFTAYQAYSAFVPWDPLPRALSPGEYISAVAPAPSDSSVAGGYPGRYHGYSYCRNKFFAWCALQGRATPVMPRGAIITVAPSVAPSSSPPPWSNDADLTFTFGGSPVVTSSEMCTFWDAGGKKRMPRRSSPAWYESRKGVTACGGTP